MFTMATPAGAGSVLAETMTLLSGFDWRERDAGDAGTTHLFVEAERYGWARATSALSERDAASRQMRHSAEELARIRTRIEQSPLDGSSRIRHRAYESAGFVVTDEGGSAVVVSLSLGARFGVGTRLAGTAFIAEAPSESGEEPTLPLLVLRNGRVGLVVSCSGSGREASIGGGLYLRSKLLKGGLEELISMPRFIPASEPRTIVCERGTDLDMIEDLNAMGHGVEWDDAVGIVHAIEISDRIAAISDPRGGTAGGY